MQSLPSLLIHGWFMFFFWCVYSFFISHLATGRQRLRRLWTRCSLPRTHGFIISVWKCVLVLCGYLWIWKFEYCMLQRGGAKGSPNGSACTAGPSKQSTKVGAWTWHPCLHACTMWALWHHCQFRFPSKINPWWGPALRCQSYHQRGSVLQRVGRG